MAKPKIALIPAAQGTKLYSVLPSDGSGDFDYTRGSSATRINAQGLIESVANTSSRLNYPLLDGKVVGCPHHILEPVRTNLVTYSESMNQYTPVNATITANALISPEGLLNAVKFAENSANNLHYFDSNSISVTSGTKYTISVFAKYNGRFLTFQGSGALNSAFATFNLQNGTIEQESVGTALIEKMPNDWYRCSIIVQMNQTGNAVMSILLNDSATGGRSRSYQGDGSSGLYLYGFQTETGSYPTSYIKSNSGSATTRLAETANGSGSAATFNDSEGCLMLEISRLNKADSSSEIISINDGSLSNYITLYYNSSGVTYTINFGSTERNGNFSMSANNQAIFNKIALKYKSQDVSLFVNGFEVDTNSGTLGLTGLNSLEFNHGNDAFDFYGKAKQIQYFDSILADTQLEQLTSWTSFTDMANGQLYTIE